MYDVIRQSTEEGIINPKKMLDFISGKAGPGTRILNEMFYGSKDTLKGMEKYLNAMVLAQSRGIEKQKGSLSFISGQFAAAGAVLGFSGFSPTGTALGTLVLAGPSVIAKLFTNKNFVDNLINLEVAKSGTNKYARSLIQVVNNLVANEFVDPILAKRFIDEAIVEDVFPNPDKAIKEMKWYDGVKDSDLTSDEADNLGILEVQGKFNRAPPGLLEQLGIDTLDSQPVAVASASETPSIAPLDLGPVTTASGPPSQTINPNTLASLESVGLPFFQAKEGGLASVDFKKFKKPQVVS